MDEFRKWTKVGRVTANSTVWLEGKGHMRKKSENEIADCRGGPWADPGKVVLTVEKAGQG